MSILHQHSYIIGVLYAFFWLSYLTLRHYKHKVEHKLLFILQNIIQHLCRGRGGE